MSSSSLLLYYQRQIGNNVQNLSYITVEHTSQVICTYSTPRGDFQDGSYRGNERPRRYWRRLHHHWLSRKSHPARLHLQSQTWRLRRPCCYSLERRQKSREASTSIRKAQMEQPQASSSTTLTTTTSAIRIGNKDHTWPLVRTQT